MTKTDGRKKVFQLTVLAVLAALIVLLGLTPLGLIPLGFINVTVLCVPVIIGTLYLDWKSGLVLGFTFGAVSFYSALTRPSALVAALMAASPVLTAVMTFMPRMCVPLTAWLIYRKMTKHSETRARKDASLIFGALLSTLFGILLIAAAYLTGVVRLPAAGENAAFELSRNRMLLLMGGVVLFAALCGAGSALLLSGEGIQRLIHRHAPAAVAAVCGSLTNTVLYLGMMLLFYVLCGIDTSAVLALIGGTALIAGLSEAAVAAVLVPPILSAVRKIRNR